MPIGETHEAVFCQAYGCFKFLAAPYGELETLMKEKGWQIQEYKDPAGDFTKYICPEHPIKKPR